MRVNGDCDPSRDICQRTFRSGARHISSDSELSVQLVRHQHLRAFNPSILPKHEGIGIIPPLGKNSVFINFG